MIQGTMDNAPVAAAYKGALKSIVEPEEVTEAIMFLLGKSSSAITGQVVEVRGGWP